MDPDSEFVTAFDPAEGQKQGWRHLENSDHFISCALRAPGTPLRTFELQNEDGRVGFGITVTL